jgi:hypothetical protein
MSQYRKKPVVIEATQWFKHGDHPSVVLHTNQSGGVIKGEGPYGWVQTLEGGHIVTTGDWIITGVKGEHYPCKPDIFAMTYEAAAPALQGEPSELSDAEICQLADRHLRGTGPHCIINFARALLSRRTVPDAAPDQDRRDAERYRWLKMTSSVWEQRNMLSTPWGQWDAVIDAAMQSGEKP